MRCGLCGFLILKPQTALYDVVQCIITCDTVRLCYFVGGFDAVFVVCAVW